MTTAADTPTTTDTTTTPVADPTGYNEMASAFDELTAPAPAGTKEAVVDTVTSPAALEAAAAAAAVKAEAEKVPTTGTTTAPVPGTTEAPATGTTDTPATGTTALATADTTATEKDWKAEYERLAASQAATAQQAAVAAQTTAQQQATQQAQKTEAPALYTEEEQALLKKHLETDWPEVARGEALVRRGEYQQLLTHIFSEVKRVYDPLIQRTLASADHVESSEMVTEIRRGHADYSDTLHDQVVTWAGTLTGMKKLVAEKVIEEGSPQDVVDLITEFKTATGKTTATAATPTTAVKPTTGNVTDISEAAKKAAKAMGVVEGKRTAAVAVEDPNDFEATWKMITADGAK